MRETELYAPVKAHLEGQGYTVKGEVDDCDVVACRGAEPPVVVELKVTLNLELILQAIERQKLTDAVYVAVPDDRRSRSRTLLHRSLPGVLRLVKLLGLGLLVVRFRARSTTVEALADPEPYRPRRSPERRRRLLREFELLRGDHNVGGSRGERVTAYRQDALACAAYLEAEGAHRPFEIRDATGVVRAQRILYDNHYGWFERSRPGEYRVSEKGVEALRRFQPVVEALAPGNGRAEDTAPRRKGRATPARGG